MTRYWFDEHGSAQSNEGMAGKGNEAFSRGLTGKGLDFSGLSLLNREDVRFEPGGRIDRRGFG
jgi:hypothetical protein